MADSTLPSVADPSPKAFDKDTSGCGLWSRILIVFGSIAMLVGALDPMEGSLIILPGSGLVALGTFLHPTARRWIVYRVSVCILIAIGVGALWWLSSVGGFGGNSGHSMWWGMLILPYLIGWSMGIWGPGSARWVLVLGMVVGAFYLAILPVVLSRGGEGHHQMVGAIVIGSLGVVTIVGCIIRLIMRSRQAG
jgi:hypothetical protein